MPSFLKIKLSDDLILSIYDRDNWQSTRKDETTLAIINLMKLRCYDFFGEPIPWDVEVFNLLKKSYPHAELIHGVTWVQGRIY